MAEKITIPRHDDGPDITALYQSPLDLRTAVASDVLVVMLHDFPASCKNGTDNIFVELEQTLIREGFHTIRFDLTGCGDRSGRTEELTYAGAVEDLKYVLGWAAEQKQFKRLVFVGEGRGAPVMMGVPSSLLKAYVFLYPAFNPPGIVRDRFHIEDGMASPIERSAGYAVVENTKVGIPLIEELQKLDLRATLKKTTLPMIIHHGAQDRYIGIDHLNVVRENARSKRLDITVYEPGEHGLKEPKERQMILFHICQFLGKYANPGYME